MTRTLTVTTEHAGERIDVYLAAAVEELSRSGAARLLEQGCVTVDGKTVGKNYRLTGGETLAIELPEAADTEVAAQDIPLDVVYEDDDVIVVNKPSS